MTRKTIKPNHQVKTLRSKKRNKSSSASFCPAAPPPSPLQLPQPQCAVSLNYRAVEQVCSRPGYCC